MLTNETLEKVKQRILQKQSFVLNIVAAWCPDCTEKQALYLPAFAKSYVPPNVDVVNLEVQRERRVYLSDEHEQFVASLGGHGFPRTVLYMRGEAVDIDNVEVLTDQGLRELALRFTKQMAE